jgi:hypothetical protein
MPAFQLLRRQAQVWRLLAAVGAVDDGGLIARNKAPVWTVIASVFQIRLHARCSPHGSIPVGN